MKEQRNELRGDEDFIGYYDYAEAAERDRQDYYNTGREEGKKEIAKELLKNGAGLKLISKSTGLSLEELENLKKEIKD